MSLDNVIPLWFGEGAWPSADKVVLRAIAALQGGDHFYQPNSGRPELRDAISEYLSGLYQRRVNRNRITVTASGMQGLALTAQALVDVGDQVICLEPAWPNVAEAFRIAGANISTVTLQVRDERWYLDIDQLLSLVTPDTRAIVINSPSNPTGWVMPKEHQQALLERCRKTGTWIVADDVYARLFRRGDLAPGFLHDAAPEDRIISVNSFSKAWSMTGWRLGWIVAPAELESTFAMLTEFNIACPAGFIQQAGELIVRDGEPEIELLNKRLRVGYTLVEQKLSAFERVQFIQPDGAFYCFFSVDGMSDSLSYAKKLLLDTRVGLAPGVAFGASGEGYLRLCYAQPEELLKEAMERLQGYL